MHFIKIANSYIDLSNQNLDIGNKEDQIIRQIMGNLNGLSSGIVELRNHYGSGHRHSAKFNSLTKHHAKLSVGSSTTLVRYL